MVQEPEERVELLEVAQEQALLKQAEQVAELATHLPEQYSWVDQQFVVAPDDYARADFAA